MRKRYSSKANSRACNSIFRPPRVTSRLKRSSVRSPYVSVVGSLMAVERLTSVAVFYSSLCCAQTSHGCLRLLKQIRSRKPDAALSWALQVGKVWKKPRELPDLRRKSRHQIIPDKIVTTTFNI